jgi:hypothetical protein
MNTRVALEARAKGRTFSTQLYDLSLTGCRFDCMAMTFSRGDKVVFKFNDQDSVRGKIAWRRAGTAGVQFTSQLPETVARHVRCDAAKPVAEPAVADWFLR